jgi:hypothetical protein
MWRVGGELVATFWCRKAADHQVLNSTLKCARINVTDRPELVHL